MMREKFKKKLRRRVKNQAGETIAEVLIALLISSLALVMLASMISATQSMVSKSKTKMDEYYAANNKLETYSGTAISGKTVSISGDGVTYSTPAGGLSVYENDVLGKKTYSYHYTNPDSGG